MPALDATLKHGVPGPGLKTQGFRGSNDVYTLGKETTERREVQVEGVKKGVSSGPWKARLA